MPRLSRSSFHAPLRLATLLVCGLSILFAGHAFANELTDLDLPELHFAVETPEKVTFSDGQTANGSFYQFAVPDGWTPADGLVIWNHGFSLSPIDPVTDLGPLVDVQLAQGFAVAASSYSLTGWALFQTVEDLEAMVGAFHGEFGVPHFVILYGASLGGIVTAQAIEQAELGNVVGAMPICGALAGSRVWDGGLDLRLIYDAVCGDVPGAAIPGGATGLPFPPDPAFDATALGTAVNVCTGVSFPATARSSEQQARLDQILTTANIPESFLLTDMGFATFGLADLVFDPAKLAGAQAMDNSNVEYGDAEIDASIERVIADPAARQHLVDHYTPSGQVADVKIVSLHTDKDGLVIVENESDYAGKVPAKNFSLGVVVEDEPSHCDFSAAEVVGAWESLRGWLAGLPQPSAGDLQAACEAVDAAGVAPGPCRIDADFSVPPLSSRIRPRAECATDQDTLCLGGRFAVEVEWTDFEGNTGVGNSVELTEDTGSFWFFGPKNLELMLKILDGRPINQHFWVFYGALSNVEYQVTITDTVTLKQKVFFNPSGTFASVSDTSAF